MIAGEAQTVRGPVPAARLGPADCHEHLFIRGGMPVLRYPDFLLVDYERIGSDLAEFAGEGGRTLVEMSPIDWGRDVGAMVRASEQFGVNVIAATGFHKTFYYTDDHWMYRYDEEDIVELLCAELLEGMDLNDYDGPQVRRTAARAGVIKVGTHSERFSDIERKLLRVTAEAHLRTGAPIVTHTDEGALALEQVEFLTGRGVAANRIALSHMDRRVDPGYHRAVAQTGAYLVYDAMTRVSKGLDRDSLGLIVAMVEGGHAGSLLVGGDISRQGYWHGYGGEPGLSFLMGRFRRDLRAAGVTDDALSAIYEHNAAALLAWSAVPATAEGIA